MKVTSLFFNGVLVFSILFGCQTLPKQLTASQYVQQSLKYIGDINSDDLKVSLQVICPEGQNRGQSYHPQPPYNSYQVETRFEIDRSGGREVAQFINPFNGFVFGGFHVLKDGKYTAYDAISSTAREITSLGFGNYRHFPHGHLQRALEDTTELVYEGLSSFRNSQAHVVKIMGDRGVKLFLHPKTYALLQVELQTVHHPYGDGVIIKKYYDYREFGPLRFPTRFEAGGVYESWGTLLNKYEVSELDNPIVLPDLSPFRRLAGDYPPARMVSLADNIYMIQNISDDELGIFDYNVLVAEFEDHILIGEAPVSNASSIKAIDMVRNHFPDKPIKYLVQSHHHSDHIGGIREYIAREVKLVVPSASQALFERIASAPWNLEPDTQSKAPEKPGFLTVEETVTFGDELNQAIVTNIGPIPHVNDMLAIYFPKQQLVWQADMITYGEWRLTLEPSVIFLEKLKKYGWTTSTIAGVHGQILDGKALEDYLRN